MNSLLDVIGFIVFTGILLIVVRPQQTTGLISDLFSTFGELIEIGTSPIDCVFPLVCEVSPYYLQHPPHHSPVRC